MKNKIVLYFCIISCATILLVMVFAAPAFHDVLQNQAFDDLSMVARLFDDSGYLTEDVRLLQDKTEDMRMTLVSPSGEVIMDTNADISGTENYGEYPEIAGAFELGYGYAVRRQTALGQDTLYYSVLLADGNVLCIAKNFHSVWTMSVYAIPGILFAMLMIFLLLLNAARKLTRRIVVTIETMPDQIENGEIGFIYDELVPFVKMLRQKNEDTKVHVQRLEFQQSQMQHITGGVSEGLIFIGPDKAILSVNSSAIRILGASEGDYSGKSIRYLSRNEKLEECIESSVAGTGKSMEVSIDGKYIHIMASPVYNRQELAGVMCFLLDITERGQNEKLRREFTANVSHELKTPLTSICGFAELLANGTVKKEDAQNFGGKIYRESLRLLDLITDIIKLSELDDSPTSAELSDCNLAGIVKACAENLKDAAQRQSISLRTEFNGEGLNIMADRIMLEQLIRNLLDNAIRYNRPGGSAAVSVRRNAGGRVELCIEDTGIGIAKKHHARIFERFYCVDKSRSKATGGTGLGLAIVKHIAEYHGADIKLDSREGEGTKICIIFP